MIVPAIPFRLEREMLEPMMSALPHMLPEIRGSKATVVREPEVGGVIPDVLIGSWGGGPIPHRLRALSRIECHVVALLSRIGPSRVERIAELGYLSARAAERSAAQLRRSGVIVEVPRGELAVSEDFQWGDIRIVAVEAKLRLWRKALSQAASYQTFADASYVVLDGNRVQPTKEMQQCFAEIGVGLVLQYGQLVRVVLSARTECKRLSPDRVWAVRKLASQRG